MIHGASKGFTESTEPVDAKHDTTSSAAQQVLTLAMPNTGSHASLPASEFTTTFAGFLDAHSDATPSERCSSSDARHAATASQRSTLWRIGEPIRPWPKKQPATPVLAPSSQNSLPRGVRDSRTHHRFHLFFLETIVDLLTLWHGVCLPQSLAASLMRHRPTSARRR